MGKAACGQSLGFLFGFLLDQDDFSGIHSGAYRCDKGRLCRLAIGFSDFSSILHLFADLFAHPLRKIGKNIVEGLLVGTICGGCISQRRGELTPIKATKNLRNVRPGNSQRDIGEGKDRPADPVCESGVVGCEISQKIVVGRGRCGIQYLANPLAGVIGEYRLARAGIGSGERCTDYGNCLGRYGANLRYTKRNPTRLFAG